jgi:hypothetical protein
VAQISTKGMSWVLALLALAITSLGGLTLKGENNDPCAAPTNPIACENGQTGNPRAEWDITGAGSPSIQGFATDISVNHGETVRFKINTPAFGYRLDIYRLGYYGGNGARKVATILPSVPLPQAQPACTTESATGLVECSGWSVSASWAVPSNAVSGVYLAKLVRTDGVGGENHIVFVVRDDEGRADLLVQTSDTTWQANNTYGGSSLYSGGPAGRAYKVSYDRPFTTRGTSPRNWLFHAEYPMLRWLEANGFDVSYTTGADSDRRGAELLEHKAFLTLGYDEYWSADQRAHVEAARAGGVHLAFFTAKSLFWKHRWEAGSDPTGSAHRTLVCYKETHDNGKIDPVANVWTGTWRDPRFSPPADGGRSENTLTGLSFAVNAAAPSIIEVPAEFGRLRFWRNTAIAGLAAGDVAALPMGTLGDEWDEAPEIGRPASLLALSRTRRTVPYRLLDFGSSYGTGTGTHTLTLYRDAIGRAFVFAAGTAQWSWGLDRWPDRDLTSLDLRMQQATLNLLTDMGAQPLTPQPGLICSTTGHDETPPSSVITSPAPGAVVPRGTPLAIHGAASDAGGSVAIVEVSTDGGLTWAMATGTTDWTFQWTPTSSGSVMLLSRAYDDSANTEVPGGGVTVTVTDPAARVCPCTIWQPEVMPTSIDSGGGSPVELGLKFQSKVRGYVTGVRFYKSPANTGPHIGNLWTTTGVRLATVTFSGESGSGWQTASFSRAVAIEPNTTYVVSYHTTTGHYSYSGNYFAGRAIENGPLVALAGPSNGLFSYSATSVIPAESQSSPNYWVDVVFDPNAPDTSPPTIMATSPSSGAIAAASVQVTVTFDEPVATETVTAGTFELRDASEGAVAVTISQQPELRRIVLTPTTALQERQTYSVRVRGGAGGVTDLKGNPLAADASWTFSTGVTTARAPDDGPGGPILIVASAANPFSRYYAEILRAEGLTAFAVMNLPAVTPTVLAGFDVVVLGEIALSAADVTMFTNWVDSGGRLVAMRPDKQLASLLGLSDSGGSLSDQYLSIDTASAPGAGLVNQTIQFHGTADLYSAAGATTVATLYSSATTSAASPAVTVRQVGTRGGQAAAFTYDLARSVVYTRQGNPAWAGQERDGIAPIRPTDMFWGQATERHWIDLDKIAIPQADEQQRLLANLIVQMSTSRRPMPRFWYLPRGLKAAVVMTSDDHGNGGTAPRFASFLEHSVAGCSVDQWDCVRATSYIYPQTNIQPRDATAFDDLGFELGLHLNTYCSDFVLAELGPTMSSQLAQLSARFPGLRSPLTNRTHCLAWSDWSTQVTASLERGIRLDTNYYYWPAAWAAARPGMFTGSGMPMRFASETGAMLDVYQAPTQITDESNQPIASTIDTLLTRATGPEGYYGVFTTNMHADFAQSDGAHLIVASARAHNVPVVSGRQLLAWLDGRNASSYRDLAWDGTRLTFAIDLGVGARDLETMIPMFVDDNRVWNITANGMAVGFRQQTIKGITYAVFTAASAAYAVSYGAPGDRLGGTVTLAATGAPLSNITVSGYRPDGSLAFSVQTNAAGAYRAEGIPVGTYYLRTANAQGYSNQVFSGLTCGASCPVTTGTAIEVTNTAPMTPVHFTLTRATPTLTYPTANATEVTVARDFEWTDVPGADGYVLHVATAPETLDVVAAGILSGTSYRITGTLPTGRTLYARVGARVGGAWRYSPYIPFTAAAARATLIYPTANATDVTVARNFEWTAVPDADGYVLHVATAPDTLDVVAAGILTGTSYHVSETLPTGRTLYARVGARVGGVWRYSTYIPFTAAASRATLIYPAANATDVTLVRDFEWTPVPGADGYVLHVATAPETLDVLAAGILTGTSYHVTETLPTDRTLYARVGARVGGVWRYSPYSAFTAAPAKATLIYPTANATNVTVGRAFEWTAVPGADGYVLHIATAPDTLDVVAAGILTGTTYQVTETLPTGTTLYARVGARVGDVWRYSSYIPFTAAAARATLIYPTANATDVTVTRDFEWTAVPGADGYVLHVATAPETLDVVAAGILTGTTYQVTETLPTGRTLYARVGARVGGVWRYSPYIPFTAAAVRPTLIYPAANATDVTVTRDFEWTTVPGADGYVLHVATAPETLDLVAAGILTGTTYQVTEPLPTGRTLYARVGARVGGVWRYSAYSPFTAAPVRATLITPVENATNVTAPCDFQWTSVPGADGYVLHIATAPETLDVLAAGILTETSYHVTDPLPTGVTLYARVGTRVGGVWRYSPYITFTAGQ